MARIHLRKRFLFIRVTTWLFVDSQFDAGLLEPNLIAVSLAETSFSLFAEGVDS